MILIAHISDPHLDGRERSLQRASRVMAYLNGLSRPVDAVVVTGDLADHGLAAEYQNVLTVLDSRSPVLFCPGNHDERGAYRRGLPDPDNPDPDPDPDHLGPVNRAHRLPGVVVLMCDSSIPGHNEGRLDDETLTWLDNELAVAPTVPTFVGFHHPPVDLHHPLLDSIRLLDEQQLTAVVDRHPQVVAVLCGHAHTAAATMFAGRPLLVAPGIASTMRLPWECGDDPALDGPPGVAFHILGDDGRLTTHYRVVT